MATATGNRGVLKRAIDGLSRDPRLHPAATRRTRDWAITSNNMAVVLETLGERESARRA